MKNAYLNTLQIHDNQNNIGFWLKPNIQGLEAPSIRLSSFERPNFDGAFVPNQLYGGRAITLEGKVSGGGSGTTYRTRRRQLEAVTRIYRPGGVLTPLTFKFKTMDDLELQVDVYVRKFEMPDKFLTGGNYKLDLFAPDIRLLSQELHQETLSIFSGGGMPIPMPIPMDMSAGGTIETTINNAGDTGALPFFVIQGPIEDPTISNQTTGESFSLDYLLATADEFITVDVETRTVLYYADANTAGVNIRDKFSGDWFEIASGNNSIKLVVADTADTGYALIRWRDAWLGI
jgi:hypothetical protein